MKVSPLTTLRNILRRADPLPVLSLGYLMGLLLAVAIPSAAVGSGLPLTPLPLLGALSPLVGCELPVFGAVALAGMTRLPLLSRLPILYRSLLWGYGSLRVYLSVGQSIFYFRYVLGCGLTLLPLCCLAKLAAQWADERTGLRGTRLLDYLCRCLFYLGLILLTLPLRL